MPFFGPSRKDVWRKLSEEIEARYVPGTFWKGDKVVAEHGEWTLTLDTYAVSTGKVTIVYTRMRAPYVNPGGFRFTTSRACGSSSPTRASASSSRSRRTSSFP